MLTKGAIGNLVNRYRAVLKKCNLINTFGSLAVASMLVLGGAGMAGAADFTLSGNSTWADSASYDTITNPGFTLTTTPASEFNAKVLDWQGNNNDTGAIDGKINASEKFTYRGTGTNSYGRELKAALKTPLLEIIGTANLQTGLKITSETPLKEVGKIYIEDNKGRTGLQFHNTAPITLKLAGTMLPATAAARPCADD